MEKINFTEEELKILHSILTKEKSVIKRMSNGTLLGKEALDNYYNDLNSMQLKIEDANAQLKVEKVKKEKIKILIVTNDIFKQTKLKSRHFTEEICKYVEDLEHHIKLKVKYDNNFNRINIAVENDDKIEEIIIKVIGPHQTCDGISADAVFIDYKSFFNKSLIYNEAILKRINEIKKEMKYRIINSKYYEKELPKLVKTILELTL